MILADTSVWIEHLRRGNARLTDALDQGYVATHPFVIGEIACGNRRWHYGDTVPFTRAGT